MQDQQMVIGNGPDALRAAAALASTGARVLLLQACATPSGRAHPELPVGTGKVRVADDQRAAVEAVLGPLSAWPSTVRAVAARGLVLPLPLNPWDVPRLLPGARVPATARSWLRVRTRNALAGLIGSGSEERSYQDWVVRRMGQPAFDALYRSYAERRFGLPADELSVSVARVHHAVPDDGPGYMVAGGEASALAHAEALIRARGGEIRCGVTVSALTVVDGKVTAVVADGASLPVQGRLWVTRPPSVVIPWLGDAASSGLRVDGAALTARDELQVALQGDTSGMPDELHVLDEGAPFYRVVKPAGRDGVAIFHSNLAPDAQVPPVRLIAERYLPAIKALGLPAFQADGAVVERVVESSPVWSRVCHSRLRRVLLRYRELGILAVGRAGTLARLDPGEELRLMGLYGEDPSPDQREIHRALIDPPVKLDDLGASITRFVSR